MSTIQELEAALETATAAFDAADKAADEAIDNIVDSETRESARIIHQVSRDAYRTMLDARRELNLLVMGY